MSPEAIKLLRDTAAANGVSETDVVEACIAKYAAELGVDVDGASALLLKQLAKGLSARKPKKQ